MGHGGVVKPLAFDSSEFWMRHYTEGSSTYEPRREKTGLRDFRPGPTQTGLYKFRSRLEA